MSKNQKFKKILKNNVFSDKSMTKIEFKATLQMLVPMIIQTIMDNKNITIIESIKLFYLSKLYEKLEIESTKLWHFTNNGWQSNC